MKNKTETPIMHEIHLALGSLPDTRLVRNNVGRAWVPRGKVERMEGGVFLPHGAIYDWGLQNGSSDLIGITRVVITPEMVGQVVGVFTSIEVKTKTGRTSKEQKNWLGMVSKFGGLGGVARSVVDAMRIIRGDDNE